MNRLTPYAAFFMRLAVGIVFFRHGLVKFHSGIPAVAGFLHTVGFPFASFFAVTLTTGETVGAICISVGFYPRFWAISLAAAIVGSVLRRARPSPQPLQIERMLVRAGV